MTGKLSSFTIGRRAVLGAALASPFVLRVNRAQAQGALQGPLVIQTNQGQAGDVLRTTCFEPFQASSGLDVSYIAMSPANSLARLQAEGGRPSVDVVTFAGAQELVAKAEGLLDDVGDLSDLNVPATFRDVDNQWTAVAAIPMGFLYNTEKIAEPPKSWADILKPEYAGHVAIPPITNFAGPPMLVMLATALGGGVDNVDPAFEALAGISKTSTIFSQAAELRMMFEQGDIWLLPYDASNAWRLAESGLPVGFARLEEGIPSAYITLGVTKGATNPEAGRAAVRAALDPVAQAGLARQLRWYPVNSDTQLEPEVAADVLVGAEFEKQAALASNDERIKIAASMAEWTDRFNREVSGG